MTNDIMDGCNFEGLWRLLFDGEAEDSLDLINPALQHELAWDTKRATARIQTRHRVPYKVLNIREEVQGTQEDEQQETLRTSLISKLTESLYKYTTAEHFMPSTRNLNPVS